MFIIDCECHLMPLADDLRYYPLYRANQRAVHTLLWNPGPYMNYGVKEVRSAEETRAEYRRRPGRALGESAAALVEKMDEAGVAMACVLPESFLPVSHGARMQSTNGWLAEEVAGYPDRLIGVCNVGPLVWRGVKHAVWEVEYLVKNMNFRAVKFYPVDDTPIDNPEIWPFYEKVQELGVPLFVHTGASYCIPGRSENCHPAKLEAVCEDFPGLTILAYHMGYPYADQLNICAAKYPNLYIGTSLLPIFGHGLGRRAQILVAEAMMWAGSDRIVWGTDLGACKGAVEHLEKFQISEEVQREYGYPALSDEDRAKWAGLNLARMLKLTPPAVGRAILSEEESSRV